MGTVSRFWVDPIEKFITTLKRSLLTWNQPLAAMILAGLIYLGLSATAGAPWRLSTAPYHNLLADAFLHGQLHLRIIPQDVIDLSLYQGRYYLYWPPLPAILAMPMVALFGIQFSDVLQTLFFSAVNVGILAMVLKAANERGVIHLTATQRAMLVLFFALGTAYTPITGSGHVWQMSQVESILFAFLAYLAALTLENKKAFFFTGCAMAGVLLTRSSAVFIAIFLAWYLVQRHWHLGMRRLVLYSLFGSLPVLITIALMGLYNYLHFDNILETGLNYHLMSGFFASYLNQHGVFSTQYIPENFYYTYIFYPYSFNPPGITIRCGSLFLLSPLFFCAFYGVWKYSKQTVAWMLLASILLGNIPLLMLMGPGSSLFGPRYTLDFIMPLLLLTSLGMEELPMPYTSLLVIISILHYILGSLIYLQGVP